MKNQELILDAPENVYRRNVLASVIEARRAYKIAMAKAPKFNTDQVDAPLPWEAAAAREFNGTLDIRWVRFTSLRHRKRAREIAKLQEAEVRTAQPIALPTAMPVSAPSTRKFASALSAPKRKSTRTTHDLHLVPSAEPAMDVRLSVGP